MLNSNNLALFLVFFWVFLYESFGSPYFGFYILPAIFSILVFFYSPLISEELNAVLAFGIGIISMSAMNIDLIFFTAPFFFILSSILYVFTRK